MIKLIIIISIIALFSSTSSVAQNVYGTTIAIPQQANGNKNNTGGNNNNPPVLGKPNRSSYRNYYVCLLFKNNYTNVTILIKKDGAEVICNKILCVTQNTYRKYDIKQYGSGTYTIIVFNNEGTLLNEIITI
ncbi:DUF3244 domain-containing protein [Leyella stercorea]|uniref:DUF3244 domain-containing protein n=1 Tax=Leyella stercorea TaxID=363265 RepID=UPI0026DBA1A3|nr:DUF3244 domain-containing protein [Leyella stercorea]